MFQNRLTENILCVLPLIKIKVILNDHKLAKIMAMMVIQVLNQLSKTLVSDMFHNLKFKKFYKGNIRAPVVGRVPKSNLFIVIKTIKYSLRYVKVRFCCKKCYGKSFLRVLKFLNFFEILPFQRRDSELIIVNLHYIITV